MLDLKRILLVEDNMNDVELTLSALEEINLANKVDVVNDGVEALDYLFCRGAYADRNLSSPAIVMLDLKLPRINGMEVLREIRNDPGLKLLSVVILTSSKEEKDILDSYNLGANAYVVKPVDFTSFIRAIRDLGNFWAVINELPPTR
jgi:CheY-like chemotaxis protein